MAEPKLARILLAEGEEATMSFANVDQAMFRSELALP